MEALSPIYRATQKLQVVGPFRIPSAMHVITDGGEVVVVDPFLLAESEMRALEKLGQPTLILITGELHARDAEAYRQRYRAKILAHRQAVPELGIAVDDTFGDGERLPGGLTTIAMPGCTAGETIFRRDDGRGVLIVGDALLNLNLGKDFGFCLGMVTRFAGFPDGLGPTPRFFMRNAALAAESYQQLLDYDFEQILVSHGSPILSSGKEKLRAVIEKESARSRRQP